MTTSRPASPRSSSSARLLLPPLAALVVAGAGWAAWQWRAASAAAAARAGLLADVVATVAKPDVDAGELSRLVALLHKLPDHATATDVLAAEARIELARGRPERAQALFGNVAAQPGASPADQGLGARMLLALHASGTADRARATALLEQVLQLAGSAYGTTRDPGDLLLVWQAAERLGRHERSTAAARDLAANHADSAHNRFVQFAMAFAPTATGAALDAALTGLAPPPAEGEAMRAFVRLQQQDVAGAVAAAEAGLQHAPGVPVVRWAAAVVFHACVLASAAGSDDRARWVERRDAQLDWMVAQGNADGPRAEQIAAMRTVR
ncbi:MAG: hypothetical protein WAT39_18965 [Planctomycetota bacterium]